MSKAAQLTLKSMENYLQHIKDKPFYPKPEKGAKLTKEELEFWDAFNEREQQTVRLMIYRQELRVREPKDGNPDRDNIGVVRSSFRWGGLHKL